MKATAGICVRSERGRSAGPGGPLATRLRAVSRARKIVVAVSVVAGAAITVVSLLVVARAWSAACCDPAGIMRGSDGGDPAVWTSDFGHGDP